MPTTTRFAHRRFPGLFGALAGALLATGGAAALRAQAVPPAKPTTKQKPQEVTVSSDLYSDSSTSRIRTLRGNVRIATEGTVLRTDLAQYNYATDVANSPGKITIDDGQNTITGDSGKAFYRTRDAAILGSVKIVVHPRASDAAAPQGSPRREFHEPVTILCDRVDYNWRSHVAVCTGHLSLRQVTNEGITRTATAPKLVYQGDPEIVTLTGGVHAQDSKGQEFDAPIAVLNIKEGAEGFHMGDQEHPGFRGKILLDDDNGADSGGTAAPGASPAAPAPGGSHAPANPDTPASKK